MSIPARYLYENSWCHMTDPNPKENIVGGVAPYEPIYFKDNIFPGDNGLDVALLIEEIINQNRYFPFDAQGKKWLWCPTMAKHQFIQHPAKEFKYPDPPKEMVEKYNNRTLINEPSMSPHIPLIQSRVELSRVELNKEAQPYWAAFKIETQERLKTVYKKLNIYQLLTKLKKDKGVELPEEVIIRVCASYAKNGAGVIKPWPWFITAVNREWQAWNATEQIRQGQEWKKAPIAPAIAEILAGMRLR